MPALLGASTFFGGVSTVGEVGFDDSADVCCLGEFPVNSQPFYPIMPVLATVEMVSQHEQYRTQVMYLASAGQC